MEPTPPPSPRIPPIVLAATLLLLALLAMGGVLRNEWVQDDTGVIRDNPLVHDWSGTWRAFAHPYWPVYLDHAELYRPLAIALFTIQWVLADGAPWVFRVGNLLAYGAAVLAVWTLLRRLAPAPAAWFGAALFAIHPVHVEAVAVSVNQGETIVAALLCLATVLYLDWREQRVDRHRAEWKIFVLFLVGLFIKEHTLMLPGLFVALELTILRAGAPWRSRVREVGPLYAALGLTGLLFWILRGAVIGPGSGTAPMEVLAGLSGAGRAATMLGVVPEWIRLLVWPAHLQADWAPLESSAYTGWTLRETIGVMGIGALLLALVLSWGRRPRIALALLWLGVALFPVSNLLLPTGVLIAERTLFLASVAVAIVGTDLAVAAGSVPALTRRPARTVVAALVALILGVGLIASATRMVSWRNRVLFVASALEDAPLSFRVRLSHAMLLHEYGDTLGGDAALDRAFELHPNDNDPFLALAAKLRRQGGACRPALSIYARLLARLPGRGDIRVGYIACATWLGEYDEAATAARGGIARRIDQAYLEESLALIDSARRARAPGGTVRLRQLPGGWTSIDSLP